ncbi:MAG: hypothetical protein GY706_00775 [Bacteroides sp.]|nr:hypothetical protein [Bacteroides sp.]
MAITMRDAAWAPWLTAIEKNDPIASMVRPWLDMTRTAHDKWLDLYENQAHTMIERSYGIMDTFRE